MPTPISRGAIDLSARNARIHLADTPASNLYLKQEVVPAGTVFAPEHDRVVVAHDSLVAFVDDEPTKNWGHKCRYLMHDPASGRLVQEVRAIMPPSFAFAAEFKPIHLGTPVLVPGRRPILKVHRLPPWIFRNPSQWYAILYAGASNNRHLNDIEFLYRTLVHTYGVPKTNITVLNYDGTLRYNNNDWTPHTGSIGNWPGDDTAYQVKIDGKGTRQALLDAIAAVGKKLKTNDNLLIHTNNHGGRTADNKTSTLCAYEGPVTLPSDFGAALAKLPKYQGLMVMMEQCYAGGFIDCTVDNSTANCTSIATAVDATHSSDGGANFDPYALAWIKAMAGTTEGGDPLSPSPAEDGNGHVTAQTAFDWSKTRGGGGDNPQFKQNGPCGGALTFAQPGGRGDTFRIPPIYTKLWPWEILPDPSPEQIRTLGAQIARLAAGHDLGRPDQLEQVRQQVLNAARGMH